MNQNYKAYKGSIQILFIIQFITDSLYNTANKHMKQSAWEQWENDKKNFVKLI